MTPVNDGTGVKRTVLQRKQCIADILIGSELNALNTGCLVVSVNASSGARYESCMCCSLCILPPWHTKAIKVPFQSEKHTSARPAPLRQPGTARRQNGHSPPSDSPTRPHAPKAVSDWELQLDAVASRPLYFM